MATLFKKLTRPVVLDLSIDWNASIEPYPQKIPDLYADEPLLVFAKSKTALKQLEIEGRLLESKWRRTISGGSTKATGNTDKKLGTLWARSARSSAPWAPTS